MSASQLLCLGFTRFRQGGLPALILLGGVLMLFHAFFFQGHVLDANHDRRDISVPFAIVCHRAVQAFTLPEWNPYIFAGTSALGSGAYVCFYPMNWIAFAFPERFLPWLLTAFLIGHVGMAYTFSYRLFRRLGGECFWSTTAATMFVFSSAAVMQMTAEINFTAFVYLPLVLYFVAAEPRTRPYQNILGQALAYSLLIMGGNPQLAIYGIGIAAAFGVDRAVRLRGPIPRVDYRLLARNAQGLGLGLLLASVRLLPFYASLKEAGGGQVSYEAFRSMSLTRPADALRFFVPEVFGTSLHANFLGSINHFETFSAYVGVAGGIAALYVVLFVWRRQTAFWNAAFIGIVLMVMGTPLARVHYFGTGGAQLLYNRLAWFLPICAAVLVAVHGAAIIERRSFRLFSLATLGIVAASVGYLLSVHGVEEAAVARWVIMAAAVHFAVFYLFFLVALAAAKRWSGQHAVARALLLLPLAVDLLLVARVESNNSNPFLSPPPFFRPDRGELSAADRLIRAGAERRHRVFHLTPDPRTSSYDLRTINNRFIYVGLYSSSGYDNSAPARIAQLYSHPLSIDRIEARIIIPRTARVAELAATAFVVTDGGLLSLANALPRARLFTRYEVAPEGRALERVLDPAFDPLSTIVLGRPPDRPVTPASSAGLAEIIVDEGNLVEVQVTTPSASVLLLADTYHPGWRATVDGVEVPVLVANHAFRAVTVGAGAHRVVWRFNHPGLAAGAWLSSIGAGVCVVLGVAALVDRRTAPLTFPPGAG